MDQLDLSTYIQIVKKGLAQHDKNESATRFLLDSINEQDYVIEHGLSSNIDSKKVSRLVNRLDPVPDGIQQASLKEEVYRNVLEYFDSDVVSDFNRYRIADVLQELADVVKVDKVIANGTKDFFLGLYEDKQTGRFLAETFLYAINRDNRKKKSNAVLSVNDVPLLSEVNYQCPVSHEPLVETIKGQPIKNYTIIKIFPEGLSAEEEYEFSVAYKKPPNLYSMDNLIALSQREAAAYQLAPTIEEYVRLREIKNEATKKYQAISSISQYMLEDEIRVVVVALMEGLPEEGLVDLEYSAIRVHEKIVDSPILQTDITSKVIKYYKYIASIFSQSEADFDHIAAQIKAVSGELESTGLSQNEVIDSLTEWIRKKLYLDDEKRLACNIVVAFFVQNCEVFHR